MVSHVKVVHLGMAGAQSTVTYTRLNLQGAVSHGKVVNLGMAGAQSAIRYAHLDL